MKIKQGDILIVKMEAVGELTGKHKDIIKCKDEYGIALIHKNQVLSKIKRPKHALSAKHSH